MKNRDLPSTEALNEIFVYDCLSGELRWRKDAPRNPGSAGKIVGSVAKVDGYRRVSVRQRKMLVHRIVWKMHYGEDPPDDIDHEDGNRSNNAIGNLRKATRSENHRNRHVNVGPWPKGVYLNRDGRFVAQIRIGKGAGRYLGVFSSPEAAHEAYVNAAKEEFESYANPGRDSNFYAIGAFR